MGKISYFPYLIHYTLPTKVIIARLGQTAGLSCHPQPSLWWSDGSCNGHHLIERPANKAIKLHYKIGFGIGSGQLLQPYRRATCEAH